MYAIRHTARHPPVRQATSPGGQNALTSTFEMMVPPGYDVGAHVHSEGEELFYVADGELDLLAFEPVVRSPGDWHEWTSSSGQRFLRGGPGASFSSRQAARTRSPTRPASRPQCCSSRRFPTMTNTSKSWQPCCGPAAADRTWKRSPGFAPATVSSSLRNSASPASES